MVFIYISNILEFYNIVITYNIFIPFHIPFLKLSFILKSML